jgi:hypothetical protein
MVPEIRPGLWMATSSIVIVERLKLCVYGVLGVTYAQA